MFSLIQKRWRSEAGYKEVILLAIPLVLQQLSGAIQLFVDRIFVTGISIEANAAQFPSSLVQFLPLSLFMGICMYVETFTAQYYGANEHHKIGRVIWQGIYIAILGGLLTMAGFPIAKEIFIFFTPSSLPDSQKVLEQEIIYFIALNFDAIPFLLCIAISSFYAGLGKTYVIMIVTIIITVINIVLDYVMIYGGLGIPAMGIAGAGYATAIAFTVGAVIYFVLFLSDRNQATYRTRSDWKINFKIVARYIRYGFPNGFQFFIMVQGFTLFILIMQGTLSTEILAASGNVFNVNLFFFLPVVGMGIATSILMGQYIGKERPDLAERAVYSMLHVAMIFMGIIILLIIVWPKLFIIVYEFMEMFNQNAKPLESEVLELMYMLLNFVALYSFFDVFNVVFSNAIKGAGDTMYAMVMIIVLTVVAFVVPSIIFLYQIRETRSVTSAWIIMSIYVCLLGLAYYVRFLTGKWKKMKVIESSSQR